MIDRVIRPRPKGRKRLLGRLLAAAATAIVMAPLGAQAADLSLLDAVEVVEDAELDTMRGEFLVADGLTIGFGAVVRTYADNALALQTQLTWTEGGPVVSSQVGALGQPLETLPSTIAGDLGLTLGEHDVGVALVKDSGLTALVHRIVEGEFQNFVFNTASDVTLRQEIDIEITLPGFVDYQKDLNSDRIGMRLADEISSALLSFP